MKKVLAADLRQSTTPMAKLTLLSPPPIQAGHVILQARFRSMWERYCRGVQAIVFVIDAADADLLDQARSELQTILQKPSLQGIPLLVLGNKNDIAGALSTGELIDRLNLKVRLYSTETLHSSALNAIFMLCGDLNAYQGIPNCYLHFE